MGKRKVGGKVKIRDGGGEKDDNLQPTNNLHILCQVGFCWGFF